jgi:hypothetical protein
VKPWSITTAGRGWGSPHGTVTSTDSGMPSKVGTVPLPDVVSNIEPFKTVVQGTSNSSSLITYRLFIEIQ